MSLYRNALPQLSGEFFLADAGIETDLIFNHGIEIREFAAHTLLGDPKDAPSPACVNHAHRRKLRIHERHQWAVGRKRQ